ncbi:MAG: hypothetical protein ACRDSL_14975 [Pseudonocardiaceae bacterium]
MDGIASTVQNQDYMSPALTVDAHIAVLSERLPDAHVNRRITEVLW